METKIIKKIYRLQEPTIDKINKLKYAKEQENKQTGIDQKVYEKDIIIDAVNYAYSAKFGKDVFDQTMTKLENVLSTAMLNILNEYTARFANSLENMYNQNEQNKEMLLLILKANGILPESQKEINALIMMNDTLEDLIKEAVLMKREFDK